MLQFRILYRALYLCFFHTLVFGKPCLDPDYVIKLAKKGVDTTLALQTVSIGGSGEQQQMDPSIWSLSDKSKGNPTTVFS